MKDFEATLLSEDHGLSDFKKEVISKCPKAAITNHTNQTADFATQFPTVGFFESEMKYGNN